MIENAAIAVFENYMSDGPGYAGKVMVVVWSGGPEFTDTYTWSTGQNSKLKKVDLE